MTGRVLNRSKATIVPMSEDTKKRVAALTASQDQYPELAFGNHDNRITMVNFDDFDYNEEQDEEYVVHEEYDEVLRCEDEFIDEEFVNVDEDKPMEEDIIVDDEIGNGGEEEGVMDGIEDQGMV